MRKHHDSIDRAILERIQAMGPGRVHTPADFQDLGSRAAVDQALSRNARAGRLRKVGRGLYELPHHHRIWGPIASTTEAVVEALARRDHLTVLRAEGGKGHRFHPPPAAAAGHSTAAPAAPVTAVFLTDGRTRRILHGKGTILLKHASPKTLAAAAGGGAATRRIAGPREIT